MTREETVRVRVRGGGAANFAAGEKYALRIAAGEAAEKWADGSPITAAEFRAVLEREGCFEVVEEAKAARVEELKNRNVEVARMQRGAEKKADG